VGQKGKEAPYYEDFDWRFACRPLSLLLIGLLDSPSEKMSSIWDSLHVRSPSAGFRDGAPVGLGAACAFLSLTLSGMMAVLYLGKGCSADKGTYCCGTLSRAIDGIRSASRPHADSALQIIHMVLHLRQRTINLFAGAVPQRMDARSGPESNRFS
jgi:hypothetical protein